MSKRHITYTKPDEPTFLKRIKQQVGYKEGPTVDTKRENAAPIGDDDFEDASEERPTVVVLRPGDLTAEEADAEVSRRLEKEEEETPADLSKPIVFKAPPKTQEEKIEQPSKSENPPKKSSARTSQKSKKSKTKAVLSFVDDDDEVEDDF